MKCGINAKNVYSFSIPLVFGTGIVIATEKRKRERVKKQRNRKSRRKQVGRCLFLCSIDMLTDVVEVFFNVFVTRRKEMFDVVV